MRARANTSLPRGSSGQPVRSNFLYGANCENLNGEVRRVANSPQRGVHVPRLRRKFGERSAQLG